MNFFDLISLFYLLIGARAVATAWSRRRELTDSALTAPDRRQLDQLAFFLLIPPGVLLHELGHALATVQLGGRVAEFHFALFWGYVVPEGDFSPLGDWWIALSGNLVSIAYGLLAVLLIRAAGTAWVKYLLLSFARFQLGWALIGYPVLTLLGFEGDWTTIYDPSTWYAGLPFAIFHAALILGLVVWNRSAAVKRWEVSLYAGAAEPLRAAGAAIAAEAGNPVQWIERAKLYTQFGMPGLAQADYKEALRLDPEQPRALFNLGQIELAKRNFKRAETHFRAALARADGEAELAGMLHFSLGLVYFERGGRDQAVKELDQAITLDPNAAGAFFWRGMAYRSLGADAKAELDFRHAAQLARGVNPQLATQADHMAREVTGRR